MTGFEIDVNLKYFTQKDWTFVVLKRGILTP
jgi:hypothetical protein